MATKLEVAPPLLTWESAAAGYAAGVTGVVFGHPLDSAKVWLQTNTAGMNKHMNNKGTATPAAALPPPAAAAKSIACKRVGSTAAMSTMAVAQTTSASSASASASSMTQRLQTLRALYSGVSGPLVTVGLVQSINFAMYDATRRYLYVGKDYRTNDSLINVAIAGGVSGTGLAVITSPLLLLKTQQQITGLGLREAFQKSFLKSNGRALRAITVGFGPHWVSEAIGRAMYYTTYEACKRTMVRQKESSEQLSIPERMMAAGASGILCWSVIFPFDALRNRLYHQLIGGDTHSTTQMLQQMIREKSLYRGFGITVLRAGPVAAAVLPVYDLTLEYLSSSC